MARQSSERGRRLPWILRREEWEQVIEAAGTDRREPLLAARDIAILALFLGAGLRRFELCGLDLGDVARYDPRYGWELSGIAHVRHGKGDKERKAPIPDFVIPDLEAYLDVRPEFPEGTERGGPLFVSRKKGRLDPSAVWRIVVATGERAGLPQHLRPHLLRHTAATAQVRKAAREGKTMYEVAENLGHASLDTLKIYTHLDAESRRDTMRDL